MPFLCLSGACLMSVFQRNSPYSFNGITNQTSILCFETPGISNHYSLFGGGGRLSLKRNTVCRFQIIFQGTFRAREYVLIVLNKKTGSANFTKTATIVLEISLLEVSQTCRILFWRKCCFCNIRITNTLLFGFTLTCFLSI